MPKPATTTQKPGAGFTSFVSKNKKNIAITTVLLLIALGILLNPLYRDWENARFLRGLAKDFPQLVNEIEQQTGLELEEKVDCSITTEKFSKGVRTCELSVASSKNPNNISKALEAIKNSAIPSNVTNSESGRTLKIQYMNKNSCQISTQDSIYLTCITAVREANIELARELFLQN